MLRKCRRSCADSWPPAVEAWPPAALALIAFALLLTLWGTGVAAEKEEPLPPFAETCFRIRPAAGFASMVEAQQMLECIGGESRLSAGDRQSVRLKGLFRVRDWTPETVVQLAMAGNTNHVRIHVWGEGQGVSLFLPHAAYRILQDPAQAMKKPEAAMAALSALVATDDRRNVRLPNAQNQIPAAPYQIRYQQAAVVVTRGNVRLLTAPLGARPKALYIEIPYDMTLRDLAVFRGGPAPRNSPLSIASCWTGRGLLSLPGAGHCQRDRASSGWTTAAFNLQRRTLPRWRLSNWPLPGRDCAKLSSRSTRRRQAAASPCWTPRANRWTALNSAE